MGCWLEPGLGNIWVATLALRSSLKKFTPKHNPNIPHTHVVLFPKVQNVHTVWRETVTILQTQQEDGVLLWGLWVYEEWLYKRFSNHLNLMFVCIPDIWIEVNCLSGSEIPTVWHFVITNSPYLQRSKTSSTIWVFKSSCLAFKRVK